MGSNPDLSRALERWFRRPPRLHGDVDPERRVSNLELFYDLVFVVLVSQIAHHLATHVSWRGLFDFMVMFGLVWNAWVNGSLYHELHSREDGRHRIYIFTQMYLLLAMAVFAGDAPGEGGRQFALVYAAFLGLITFQWWEVARRDGAVYRPLSMRYVASMVVSAVAVLASGFMPSEARMLAWAGVVLVNVLAFLTSMRVRGGAPQSMVATDSMVERFDAFTIIVLGEVVVGVMGGIVEAGSTTRAVVLGLTALTIGFGFWWNYFDVVAGRLPRNDSPTIGTWLELHLPLHGTIAMSGAAMVSLVGHGSGTFSLGEHVPAGTTWLLAGSTACLLLIISALVATVDYPEGVAFGTRWFQTKLWLGAAACALLGLVPMPAWLLAAALGTVLGLTWWAAFYVRATRGHGATLTD